MAWDWGQIIPALIGAAGSYMDRKSASPPDPVEQISVDDMLRMMFQNSVSPRGNSTYTQGPDGYWTRTYEFTPRQQEIDTRMYGRAMNPDQAYQLPGQLQQLQQALMNQRLERLGITPDPSYMQRQPQGDQTPFEEPPTQEETVAPVDERRGPPESGGGNPVERTGEPSNATARDVMGQPSLGMRGYWPGSGPSVNGWLNRNIPGAAQPTSGWKAWLVDHADEIGQGVAGMFGPPGSGYATNKLIDALIERNFYGKGGSLQSPANIPPSELQQAIDEGTDYADIAVGADRERPGARSRMPGQQFGPGFSRWGAWTFTDIPNGSDQRLIKFSRSGH